MAVGGVHATVCPDDFKCEFIDYIAVSAEDFYKISNCKDTRVRHADRNLPEKYTDKYYYLFAHKCVLVKTSFGCPYNCNFCFCKEISRYKAREIGDVIAELLQVPQKEVYIVGIEASTQNELDEYDKKSKLEYNEKAVMILKKYGIECYATVILGVNWDKSDFKNLYNYIKHLGLIFVNLQPFTPMPGTSYFDKYKEELIIPYNEHEKWDMAHLVIKPGKITARRYYFERNKLIKKSRLYFVGLAPAILASLVPNWEFECCLETIEDVDFETDADIIAISGMGHAIIRSLDIAKEFKKRGKTVVMGGYMASLMPKEAKKYCDSVIIGDGEIAFPKLVSDYENGNLQEFYNIPLKDLSYPLPKYEIFKGKRIGNFYLSKQGEAVQIHARFALFIACIKITTCAVKHPK